MDKWRENMRKPSKTLLLVAGLVGSSMGMKPFFTSGGLLLLDQQGNTVTPNTEKMAMIGGVEQWYRTWFYLVQDYVTYSSPRYEYLPTSSGNWVYTQLTPSSLANLIYQTYWLDIKDTPTPVYNAIVSAITSDKNHSYFSQDPYPYWKWRSAYMEGRYAEDGNTTWIYANCWGTADYLAADLQWKGYYQSTFPNGAPNWAYLFPHIYLDGPIIDGGGNTTTYALDRDYSNTSRSKLVAYGHSNEIFPGSFLNSFDLIRYSGNDPTIDFSGADLVIGGHDLGWLSSGHSAVYLGTDALGDAYLFEKANLGATANAPYQIRKYGVGTYDDPSGHYTSFFKKFGANKLNLATTNNQNWAGIKP
jgi:hypothetical protein